MKRNGLILLIALGQIFTSSLALANKQGFFIGAGGSYDSVKTHPRLTSDFDAVSGFPPTGVFDGQRRSYDRTKYVLAPYLQLGYFHPVACGEWTWGVKFLYQYLNAKSNISHALINYDSLSGAVDQVTGSVQTNIQHELALLFMPGFAYEHGLIYFGIGPVLFGTQDKIQNLNDTLSGLYIGNLNHFSNQSHWVWGAMAEVGVNYYFTPTTFIDVNYIYSSSGRYSSNNSAAFSPATGGLNTGNITFNTSKDVIAQSIMISVNKVFY